MSSPNIRSHTAAICKKLGLEPHLVRRMILTPSSVTAEVYLTNARGAKYIKEDGNVALETRNFEVSA